jgi:lysozyme family protein
MVLNNEGGYVNDPNDPGGETNLGICKRAYPNVNIKNLTETEAVTIYRQDYWDKCRCDDLPECIQALVFDAAVNQGTRTAIVLLQRALKVKDDGVLGPITIGKAREAVGPNLVRDYTVERILYYTTTTNFQYYGKSWVRRAVGAILNI